jgi:CRISPR-associated protein Cmr3
MTGIVHPRSLFPPLMNPLQGAVRTMLAVRRGWRPDRGEFPHELGNERSAGNLRFTGPFILERNKWLKREEWLYPAPLVLFGRKKSDREWEVTRLKPGAPVECDLGKDVYLPAVERRIDGGDLLEVWLTKNEMETVLAGNIPRNMKTSSELWGEEARVGIARDRATGTAKDRHLYSLTHVRPTRDLHIAVGVDGIPPEWHPSGTFTLPLGGEGRFAAVEVEEGKLPLPRMPELKPGRDGLLRFTVSLLTPAKWEDESGLEGHGRTEHVIRHGPEGIPGTCVSAVIGRLLQIGGWDRKNNKPRPVLPYVPAGSIWFYEAPASALPDVAALHGGFVGLGREFGFGQIVIGIWHKLEEGTR